MFTREEPGGFVSAAVHTAVLVASLVAFSGTPKFEDAQESIPVEMITENELNQITRGERDAKPENLKPRVDEQSERQEQRPTPPVAEAKRDIPTPPPPLKRIPDPAEDETPEPPKVAVLPPQRPAPPVQPEPEPAPPAPPVRPPQPKAEPAPEPPRPLAREATEPPPPPQRPKPEPQQQAEAKPDPVETKPAPVPPRRPPALRKVEDKPKPDQLARLVETTRDVKPAPAARPRSGEESTDPARRYDPSAISRIISREPAQQRGSTGQTPQRTTALGAPTATAARMSPSLSAQLNGLLIDQYKRCWSYIGTARGSEYKPQVSVSYSQTGGLVGRPTLRNPPSDPALRSLAESALRAVQNPRCNPLQIPAQFMPYYNEWKDILLRFDPEEMMG